MAVFENPIKMNRGSDVIDGKSGILHIITRLDAGGSAQNTALSAVKVNKSQFRSCVAAGTFLVYPDVKKFIIPHLQRELNPWNDFLAFWEILRLIRRLRPDIVHTHSSKAGILGRWAAFLYNCLLACPSKLCPLCGRERSRVCIVHTPHGHVFYGYFGRLKTMIFTAAERVTALITDVLVALTNGELEESVALGVGARKKWTVIHSGVELVLNKQKEARNSVRLGLGIPETAILVGTAARLEPVKGVEYFIRAAAIILNAEMEGGEGSLEDKKGGKGKDIYFVIAGDGQLRKELEELAASCGLKGRMIFTGHRENLSDFMAAMDIYVQPSLNEGMGRTIVEACFAGLPVVASRVCGIPDVVKDKETGLLVPPGDARLLAGALVRLISDPGLRTRFGTRGREWVTGTDNEGLPRFGTELMVLKLSGLYLSLS